jgi:hypothetical protein
MLLLLLQVTLAYRKQSFRELSGFQTFLTTGVRIFLYSQPDFYAPCSSLIVYDSIRALQHGIPQRNPYTISDPQYP